MDIVFNFGKLTLAQGYTSGAVSVELITGEGSSIPDPATYGAYNLVWWDATVYDDPADDPNKEIVRVTAISGDTLTITRAQEGTSATDKNTSASTYKMIRSLTKADLETILDSSGTPVSNEYARFTDENTLEGRSVSEVRSDINVEDGADVTDTNNVGQAISGATVKTNPADSDILPIFDSVLKKITWSNIKAAIKSYYDSVTTTLTNKTLSTGSVIDSNVTVIEVLKKVYPVGSEYTNWSDSTNPATLFGFGTWVAESVGVVKVGIDIGDTDFDTVGETGGAKTHQLTEAELAQHKHTLTTRYNSTAFGTSNTATRPSDGTLESTDIPIGNTGSNIAHNNLQPYKVAYVWKRTA